MKSGSRHVVTLLAAMIVLLLLPLSLVSLVAVRLGDRLILPELDAKALSVARAATDRLGIALAHGIPLDRLVGIEDYLAALRADAGAIAYVAVSTPDDRVLYASGETPERLTTLLETRRRPDGDQAAGLTSSSSRVIDAILGLDGGDGRFLGRYLDSAAAVTGTTADPANGRVATVHVGVRTSFVRARLRELLLDVVVVGLVAILVAFELLLLVVTISFSAPLALARRLLGDIAEWQFTRTGRMASRDEIGRLVDALNGAILKVNVARSDLLARAADVSRRGGDAARRAADAVVARLDGTGAAFASGAPATERPSWLVVVRPLVFLFVAAEELGRPFLPVYIEGYARDVTFADRGVLIGLPISTFMLVAAVAILAGGVWSDRVGRRATFATGALVATAGLAGTALAPDYWWLLVSRLAAGTGYGLAFVSCQGYVIDRTTRANRSQGIAMFVGGIMAADICGPAIGGILADRIGFVPTILAGAVLALGSAALALVLLDGREDVLPVRRASALAGAAAAVANWRFDLLVLLAALPAKLLLTGFLFYLAPLLLADLGASQSEAGRIVMTYGIAAFLLGPAFAHASDRLRAHGVLVCAGGVVCGVAMLPILFTATPAWVLVGVVGSGSGRP